jgi:hypothetical protein
MPLNKLARKRRSQGETSSDDCSSEGHEKFVISPRPKRATRKAARGSGESSSRQVAEEAVRLAVEGCAVAATREARASDVI